jgi:hypothetical protein
MSLNKFLSGLAILLGLSLVLQNCKKESPLVENTTGINSTMGVDERNGLIQLTPLSKSAINHKVNADYDFVGQTYYEHHMYNSHRHPSSYFNFSPETRNAIASVDLAFGEHYAKLSKEDDIINRMYRDGLIGSFNELDYLKDYIRELVDYFDVLENESMVPSIPKRDFGTVYFDIMNKEQSVLQSVNLTEEQKFTILSFSSYIRNHLKFLVSDGEVEERGMGCWRGIKAKCWLRYGIALALKITAYTLLLKKAIIVTGGVASPAA